MLWRFCKPRIPEKAWISDHKKRRFHHLSRQDRNTESGHVHCWTAQLSFAIMDKNRMIGERRIDMIRHIVLFKIKEEYKQEIPQLVRNFEGMKGRIEGLIDLEAGQDILHSERSYDLALITLFRDRESFDAYQTHPVHMPVKKRMHEVRSGSVACDFEI